MDENALEEIFQYAQVNVVRRRRLWAKRRRNCTKEYTQVNTCTDEVGGLKKRLKKRLEKATGRAAEDSTARPGDTLYVK
jgi:hypothetical protein